jgi:hypothetical protein
VLVHAAMPHEARGELPASVRPAADARLPYLDELIERSDALQLARDDQWRALLHYRKPPLRRGFVSHADDPDFFLAADGKRDPRAELHATLRAFFEEETRPIGDDEQHAQCAFIARYHWLRERLDFDPRRLPGRECPLYAQWRAAVNPAGMTLVFAEAFMNNPASMFGHTLLRVDTKETPGDHGLLGWAIDFSGATGDEGGPLYAAKGIVGLYDGFYDLGPYYDKVKEYGDWENRDIWEYRLDLSPEEIDRILMHLWEMQGIAFEYYYFDENCSFQLMALIESARPELRLTAQFPLTVIPADTVRSVVREQGLLREVHFRPAAATELRAESRELSRDERRLARLVAAGTVGPDDPLVAQLPDDARAAVLFVAYDYLRYIYLAGDVSRAESAPRAHDILVARSRVGVQGFPFAPVPTPAVRPDEGHESARLAVAAGYRTDRSFFEVRFRPALHDLLDPEGGYTRGAQIQFLDTAVRVFPETGKVRLHELVVLDMLSLVPWDAFFRPISFTFDMGLRTRLFPDGGGSDLDPEPVWRTRGGVGLAFDFGERVLAYGMVEATGDLGSALDDDVAIGVGGGVGLTVGTPSDRWKAHAFARVSQFVLGDTTTALQAGLEQRLTVTRRTALELESSYHRDFGEDWFSAALGWNFFF